MVRAAEAVVLGEVWLVFGEADLLAANEEWVVEQVFDQAFEPVQEPVRESREGRD